jgi:hypothetical protein
MTETSAARIATPFGFDSTAGGVAPCARDRAHPEGLYEPSLDLIG